MANVKTKKRGCLYWITGLSGAGKTTIGNRLFYELRKTNDNVVLLDGDMLKNIVSDTLGYSEVDRRKRAMKYAALCKILTDQGQIVICCTIAMYDEVREWNRKNNKGYVEVFLKVPLEVLQERDQKGMYSKVKQGEQIELAGVNMDVEFPKSPDIILENDGRLTINECVERILNYNIDYESDYDRDTNYWNKYYGKKHDIEHPSLFAKYVGELLKKNGNLLELGCGNGRDSIYFSDLGLNVTAIDASDKAIEESGMKYKNNNICFVCDDFVRATAIFVGQYEYVYSRFSLHAINEEQEDEVIHNVYNVLKKGGMFFVEARSINDDIFGKGKKIARNTYFYEGHSRRFLVKEELEKKLKSEGFIIEYSEEQVDFAPFGDSNPPIIRLVCRK